MNDPENPYGVFLKTLSYKVIFSGAEYKVPLTEISDAIADYRIEADKLIVSMKRDFRDLGQAKQSVEQTLERLTLWSELQFGSPEIRFEFVDSQTEMRTPPPAGTIVACATLNVTLQGVAPVILVSVKPPVRTALPVPPTEFTLTPNVRTLLDRLRIYSKGHESLAAMGYFCLTMFEDVSSALAGNMKGQKRTKAAKMLNTDWEILDSLGRLTSEHGYPQGRKADAIKQLTDSQREWLTHALRRLIVQLGALESGVPLTRIRMADLPPLHL